MTDRRTFLTTAGATITAGLGGAAGYLYRDRQPPERIPTENNVSLSSPPDGYDTTLSGSRLELTDWVVSGGVELFFAETLGFTTADKNMDQLVHDDFEFRGPSDGEFFALMYAVAYNPDDPKESAPASMWGLDVWDDQNRYRPLGSQTESSTWFHLPESHYSPDDVLMDRICIGYPENIRGGGWLCFEVGSSDGTFYQLFGAEREDFNLDLDTAEAYWSWNVSPTEPAE